MEFAKKDKEFLVQQIDMINPDIIVCGGTFWPYFEIYNGNTSMEEKSKFLWNHGKRIVIQFKHPGYKLIKGGAKTLYNQLKDILQPLTP